MDQDELGIKRKATHLPMDVVNSHEDRLFYGRSNYLSARQTARGFHSCTFQLEKFPFDTQTCNFFIKFKTRAESFVNKFIIEKVEYRGSPILSNFRIMPMKAKTTIASGDRSFLMYTLIMKRQYINQLLTIFFPSWLIWLIAYLTFFVPLKNFNNRFMGSLTSLLVLTSLLNTVEKTLPQTAYFKNIDCWFLWFISNSIVMIAAHVLIDNLSDSTQNKLQIGAMSPNESDIFKVTNVKKKKLNQIMIIELPVINIFFYLFYFLLHL